MYNILLVGIDEVDSSYRSDVLILLNINKKNDSLNIISIPRDSIVNIPCGLNGSVQNKINHSYNYGELYWGKNEGISCVTQAVSNLFEIQITPYILVTFSSFVKLIDTIDGIEIIPRFSFSVTNDKNQKIVFTKDKKINLNGKDTLLYVRYRKSLPRGDLDRVLNEQDVLKAIISKINKLERISKMKLFLKLNTFIKNNIPIDEMYNIIKLNFEEYQIKTYTLKGSIVNEGGSYYKIDKNYLNSLRKELFYIR